MSQKNEQIIPRVDPYSNEKLEEKNGFLVSQNSQYQIINKIPNFLKKIDNKDQEQVKNGFDHKWENADYVANDQFYEKNLKQFGFEMLGITEDKLSIFDEKLILDIGVGTASSARIWASHAKEFHGIDISNQVFRAYETLKRYTENPVISQADLNFLPYPDNSFDIIVSNGVLHHTPSTKNALKNIIKKLKPGGQCIFYIYKLKSPIREFSDDYIRNKISNMEPDKALKEMEKITNLGKSLHNQKISIQIPEDIDLLGLKKGTYDFQMFLYQYIVKCFWNDSLGFDASNICNFDWFYPKFCWRHSKEEIENWCDELNLSIDYVKETMSGFACSVIKNK